MLHILLIYLFSFLHPFYVSVTEVRHNEKTKSLEISCRLFYDDLEKALEKNYKADIDILKPAAKKELIHNLIGKYLKKHLQLTVDGKLVPLHYLGYEIEEEAAWCYLEVPVTNDLKRLDVKNELLFDEHPEQTNMMHVTVRGQRKSTKLDNPDNQISFSF